MTLVAIGLDHRQVRPQVAEEKALSRLVMIWEALVGIPGEQLARPIRNGEA